MPYKQQIYILGFGQGKREQYNEKKSRSVALPPEGLALEVHRVSLRNTLVTRNVLLFLPYYKPFEELVDPSVKGVFYWYLS